MSKQLAGLPLRECGVAHLEKSLKPHRRIHPLHCGLNVPAQLRLGIERQASKQPREYHMAFTYPAALHYVSLQILASCDKSLRPTDMEEKMTCRKGVGIETWYRDLHGTYIRCSKRV